MLNETSNPDGAHRLRQCLGYESVDQTRGYQGLYPASFWNGGRAELRHARRTTFSNEAVWFHLRHLGRIILNHQNIGLQSVLTTTAIISFPRLWISPSSRPIANPHPSPPPLPKSHHTFRTEPTGLTPHTAKPSTQARPARLHTRGGAYFSLSGARKPATRKRFRGLKDLASNTSIVPLTRSLARFPRIRILEAKPNNVARVNPRGYMR
ncbi:uncharacterized protein BDZ99DRAFT_464192 [Mytilinidion resinicola]|uniref:Uncharacterized protein n=1 Tax=Mytilinidion resinicola TaxID=574789 RepID=A0A6A6YHL6_9PEZI|nr:uncharacterized protein BDZ99DRAFT_464192 [Mytilinidion resinicola]KAF2808316.1 hypothetical protein BDZ99DRAFT_464192 [Mytilinidion resinicola]